MPRTRRQAYLSPSDRRRPPRRPEWLALLLLLVFTLFAIAGYAVFGLHPQLLAYVPDLAGIYGPAFTFFAQGHVWLSGLVLAFCLVRRARWRWLLAFGGIYALSLTSELIGTTFGLPFGPYHYTDSLGPKWLGRVPWLIPLSWFSMAVPAYVLALRRFPDRTFARIVAAAALLTLWDLSLDPAMSFLTSYWIWDEPGVFYGMPLINLAGWFLTAAGIAFLMSILGADSWARDVSPKWAAAYFGVVLLMPFGMIVAAGLWAAAALTVLALALWYLMYRSGMTCDDPAGVQDTPAREPERPEAAATAFQNTAFQNTAFQNTAFHLTPLHPATPKNARYQNATFQNTAPGAPDELDGLLRDSAFIQRHSRSFAFATRFLTREERRIIEELYRFCRTTDDLVDLRRGRPLEQVERDLDLWMMRAAGSYEGRPTGIGWLDGLMRRSRHAGVPLPLICQLGAGVRTDLDRVEFETMEELDAYAYRVASVVGIWLCYLFGATEKDTFRRASIMGWAMQVTNILRDVGEDLRNGRVYLPREVLASYGLARADLERMVRDGETTPDYRDMIEALACRAERAYEEALPGLVSLPARPARAFAVAGGVYRGILDDIRANDYDNLHRRARTTSVAKVRLAIGSLVALVRVRALTVGERARVFRPGFVQRLLRESAAVLLLVVSGLFAVSGPAMAAATALAPFTTAARSNHSSWLQRLRSGYLDAVDNPEALEATLDAIERRAGSDPLTEGYRSALIVLEAKHARWPLQKWRYLQEGLGGLDALVEEHPQDVEIRYLRLLSCYFLPGFLGRGWSVDEDFAALAHALPHARGDFPTDLFHQMVGFVLESGDLDPAARDRLEAALREIDVRSEAEIG